MPTMYEMIREAVNSREGEWQNHEIIEYILNKWPNQNADSIQAQINSSSVNVPSRLNYDENKKEVRIPREKEDVLFRKERGTVERYDQKKHGVWGIFEFRGGWRIYKGSQPPQIYNYNEFYGVLYHTDLRWLEFLKGSGRKVVNFWSSRENELANVYEGMPFFFKTERQKIEGVATLLRVEKMSVADAWAEFGTGNGAGDKESFVNMLKKDTGANQNINDQQITCFVLKNPVFFDNPPSLSDCGITEFQTMKYIDSIEGGSIIMAVEREIPDALDIPVEVNGMYQSLQLTNGRGYQSNLRDILMQTYGGKCAICEMDIPELLVVSHIIPHSKNENTARRLDNAIFLCKLHDSMFDQGFLTVLYESGKYFLKVSEQIKESTNPAVVKIYKELSTSMFHPPIEHPPSEESLRYHNSYVFLDNKKSEKL